MEIVLIVGGIVLLVLAAIAILVLQWRGGPVEVASDPGAVTAVAVDPAAVRRDRKEEDQPVSQPVLRAVPCHLCPGGSCPKRAYKALTGKDGRRCLPATFVPV